MIAKRAFAVSILLAAWLPPADEAAGRHAATDFMRIVAGIRPSRLQLLQPPAALHPELSGQTSLRWTFSDGRHEVVVDAASNSVVDYSNHNWSIFSAGANQRNELRWVQPFYSGDDGFLVKAKYWLDKVGWKRGPIVSYDPLPKRNGQGMTRVAALHVRFYEKPNGFSSEGSGNVVVIGLDNRTGEVIDLHRAIGFTPAAPKVKISRAQAVDIAASATPLGNDRSVIGPMYRQMAPRYGLSKRGQALSQAKILPLCYIIADSRVELVIAADTGEILSRSDNRRG